MRTTPVTALAMLFLCPAAVHAQEDVFPLDGIVVTTSPTPRSLDAVSSHVTILSGEELRIEGITSVAEALRDEASLSIVRSGSFGGRTSLFLRGGESDHTLVLVDGVQVNEKGGSFDFSSLTTDNVERIEIVRGPASALYGADAMAGVIHIVTRVGRGSPHVRAGVETSYYSEPRDELLDGVRWSADVTGGSDLFGYSASLAREQTDGILDFNNQFISTVASGSARFAPDDRTRASLSLRVTDREFHFPTDNSGQVSDRNAFSFGDETTANLTVARRVTDAVELQGTLSVSEMDTGTDDAPDDTSDPNSFRSLEHFRRSTGDVRGHITVGDAVVTVGGEIEEERQRSFNESQSAFGPSFGRSGSERQNLAAFGHVTGERGVAAFNAGARLEDNDQFGSAATWQAGFTVRMPDRPGTRVRTSYGTAIKEPSFFESFATGFATGNPDLDPERSRSWEVGFEHAITDGATVQATFFDQRIKDLIQYTGAPPNPGDPNYFNVAGATSRGIEVGAQAGLGPLEVGASYSWLHTEVTNSGFDSGPHASFVEGEALLRRPEHTFAARVAHTLAGLGRVYGRMSYVGVRADRTFDPTTFAPRRLQLDSYVLLAAGGTWDVAEASGRRPSVSVSVRGENLLDQTYEEAFGFDAPGRQIYFGVSMGVGGAD